MDQTLRLRVAYDGTRYHGWQRQLGRGRVEVRDDPKHADQTAAVPTIQETVEVALGHVLNEPVTIEGAGRTDGGVHALAQCASFTTSVPRPLERILAGANANLPTDVAIRAVEPVPTGFHARFDATGKTYRYTFLDDRIRQPQLAGTAFHARRPIDLIAMQAAADVFVGRHDFFSLATLAKQKASTVRTIHQIRVARRPGEPCLVDLYVRGDGFLYNQVRTLAGTLLEVGTGRRTREACAALLRVRDRRPAGPNLPPHGLCLVEVHYPTGDALAAAIRARLDRTVARDLLRSSPDRAGTERTGGRR